jgi:hypothetical protein
MSARAKDFDEVLCLPRYKLTHGQQHNQAFFVPFFTTHNDLSALQSLPSRCRIASTIKNGANLNDIAHNAVIDRERKTTGETTVRTKNHTMNASIKKQRVNVREK